MFKPWRRVGVQADAHHAIQVHLDNESFAQAAHTLNQKALGLLHEFGMTNLVLSQTDCLTLTDHLLEITDKHRGAAFKATWRTFGASERHKDLVRKAICHEYESPDNVYTLYRAGSVRSDRVTREGRAHLISFGASAAAGDVYDG